MSKAKKSKKPQAKSSAKAKAKPNSKAKPKAKAVARAAKPVAKKGKPAAKTAKPAGKTAKPATQAKAPSSGAKKSIAKVATIAAGVAATVAATIAMKKRAKGAAVASFFTPLDDRILVEKLEPATRTPGGLYIPDTVASDERSSQGKVVAVGRGHRNKKGLLRPLDVQLGDTVMFANGGGSDVRIEEQDLLCLREEEIIAITKP